MGHAHKAFLSSSLFFKLGKKEFGNVSLKRQEKPTFLTKSVQDMEAEVFLDFQRTH